MELERTAVMSDDPEDQAIDVTIEALTGTVYDLCVSPFETILGIKLKIQRLEGKLLLDPKPAATLKFDLGVYAVP